jgi:hypothetical protein
MEHSERSIKRCRRPKGDGAESHTVACSHDHSRGTRFAASADSIFLHMPPCLTLFKRLGCNTHACTRQASTASLPHDSKQQPNHSAPLTCIPYLDCKSAMRPPVRSTSMEKSDGNRLHRERLCSLSRLPGPRPLADPFPRLLFVCLERAYRALMRQRSPYR